MKQALLKFAGKKFITAAFLSASLLFTSFSSKAAFNNNYIEILSGENTNVQFNGSTADALMFKVHINNEEASNFTLTIKNESGDILFSKSFSDVNFQKQFKLLKTEADNEKYYFTITSENKSLEDNYVISTATHVVDDVVINKL